jgi:hypothetical protein
MNTQAFITESFLNLLVDKLDTHGNNPINIPRTNFSEEERT